MVSTTSRPARHHLRPESEAAVVESEDTSTASAIRARSRPECLATAVRAFRQPYATPAVRAFHQPYGPFRQPYATTAVRAFCTRCQPYAMPAVRHLCTESQPYAWSCSRTPVVAVRGPIVHMVRSGLHPCYPMLCFSYTTNTGHYQGEHPTCTRSFGCTSATLRPARSSAV